MDYACGVRRGERGRRRTWPPPLQAVLRVLALLMVMSILPAFLALGAWSEVQALKAEWTIEGPPCPIVTELLPSVVGRKPAKTFRYGDAEFSRAFGAAFCAAIPEDRLWTRASYRVCQFNNPGAVTVRTDGRSVIFQPPVGRRLTVTVRDGVASCVVGGWFNY